MTTPVTPDETIHYRTLVTSWNFLYLTTITYLFMVIGSVAMVFEGRTSDGHLSTPQLCTIFYLGIVALGLAAIELVLLGRERSTTLNTQSIPGVMVLLMTGFLCLSTVGPMADMAPPVVVSYLVSFSLGHLGLVTVARYIVRKVVKRPLHLK